ncbi:hypothetical protein BH23BAC1_BH23BAC1_34290 [soil metagenome]
MKKYIFSLLIIFTAFTFVKCKEEAPELKPVEEESNYKSITKLYEVSLNDFRALAQVFGQTSFLDKIKHGVEVYKIVYETTYQGQPINASGVVYIPTDLTSPAPILSIQHVTTFVQTEAPSMASSFSGLEYFAAGGYITFIPDFIGYGESANIFHPYYDKEHSAAAVIDIIKAGKKYLTSENIPINDNLFLAGYSEGGYVTMAAAKEIDQNPQHGMNLSAVAAGAGGYDLREMLETVTSNEEYPYPAYLAFVIMSYNKTYNWNRPLNYFFNEKYAAVLPSLMDGTKNGTQINNSLTTNLSELFNKDFFQRLKLGEEQELEEAFISNSFGYDEWTPTVPIRLYHGTADEIVPDSNTEKVYNLLNSKGATNLELKKISGGTHGSTLIPMIQSLVPWFESLQANKS